VRNLAIASHGFYFNPSQIMKSSRGPFFLPTRPHPILFSLHPGHNELRPRLWRALPLPHYTTHARPGRGAKALRRPRRGHAMVEDALKLPSPAPSIPFLPEQQGQGRGGGESKSIDSLSSVPLPCRRFHGVPHLPPIPAGDRFHGVPHLPPTGSMASLKFRAR
jgi:hypothetical protein